MYDLPRRATSLTRTTPSGKPGNQTEGRGYRLYLLSARQAQHLHNALVTIRERRIPVEKGNHICGNSHYQPFQLNVGNNDRLTMLFSPRRECLSLRPDLDLR
jgi:hypothetical protein